MRNSLRGVLVVCAATLLLAVPSASADDVHIDTLGKKKINRNPRLVYGPPGQALLLWDEANIKKDRYGRIWGAQVTVDDDGHSVGDPFEISTDRDSNFRPSGIWLPNTQRYLVTWDNAVRDGIIPGQRPQGNAILGRTIRFGGEGGDEQDFGPLRHLYDDPFNISCWPEPKLFPVPFGSDIVFLTFTSGYIDGLFNDDDSIRYDFNAAGLWCMELTYNETGLINISPLHLIRAGWLRMSCLFFDLGARKMYGDFVDLAGSPDQFYTRSGIWTFDLDTKESTGYTVFDEYEGLLFGYSMYPSPINKGNLLISNVNEQMQPMLYTYTCEEEGIAYKNLGRLYDDAEIDAAVPIFVDKDARFAPAKSEKPFIVFHTVDGRFEVQKLRKNGKTKKQPEELLNTPGDRFAGMHAAPLGDRIVIAFSEYTNKKNKKSRIKVFSVPR